MRKLVFLLFVCMNLIAQQKQLENQRFVVMEIEKFLGNHLENKTVENEDGSKTHINSSVAGNLKNILLLDTKTGKTWCLMYDLKNIYKDSSGVTQQIPEFYWGYLNYVNNPKDLLKPEQPTEPK
ncbi:MAG: hypothetical protein PHP42_00765 [Bacteroidota bacterium]|nr:hypothetical protein [Bacteroidota bacterium]